MIQSPQPTRYDQLLDFLRERMTDHAEIALAPNVAATLGVNGPFGDDGGKGSYFFYNEDSLDLARAALELNIPVHLSAERMSLPSPHGQTPGVDMYEILENPGNVIDDPK